MEPDEIDRVVGAADIHTWSEGAQGQCLEGLFDCATERSEGSLVKEIKKYFYSRLV
jgi:hypothetical protein